MVTDIAKNIAADPNVREHIHEVVKASGSSFYLGMRILPPNRRNGMFAIYAFCREVDDIADSSEPEEEKDAGKPVEPTESMPEQDPQGFPEPAQGIDNK